MYSSTGHFNCNFYKFHNYRGEVAYRMWICLATYFTQIYGSVFPQVLLQTQIYNPFSATKKSKCC